jgi:hypothetical protein
VSNWPILWEIPFKLIIKSFKSKVLARPTPSSANSAGCSENGSYYDLAPPCPEEVLTRFDSPRRKEAEEEEERKVREEMLPFFGHISGRKQPIQEGDMPFKSPKCPLKSGQF